jgi:hypothetical protein
MQGLTKKRPTEKQVEVRFRGTHADVIKLRRMAQALKVKDVTEWELEEKELYELEEVSPSFFSWYNDFSTNSKVDDCANMYGFACHIKV